MRNYLLSVLIISILSVLSFNLYAFHNELSWGKFNNDTQTFALGYPEDGKWIFEVFEQQTDEFQKKIHSRSFTSKENLLAYQNKNFPDLLSGYKIVNLNMARAEVEYDTSVFGFEMTNFGYSEETFEYDPPIRKRVRRNKEIWKVINNWSQEWEKKYSNWLQNEVDIDIFKRHGVRIDCADVIVGLRWIFARNNGLPAASHLAGTGDLFSQSDVLRKWRRLTTADKWYNDQLFMRALDYLMGMTSTRTIIHDGYPITLDQKGLVPGVYILSKNNGSGHVRIISEVYYKGESGVPIFTLASTSPRQVRSLGREIFSDEGWPYKKDKELLSFRWPQRTRRGWVLKSSESHFNYSPEQFDENLKATNPNFVNFIISRVRQEFAPDKLVQEGIKDISDYIKLRIKIVADGFKYCQSNDCSEGTSNWDDWSTPSRDSKIEKKFIALEKMVLDAENISPEIFNEWLNALSDSKVLIDGSEISLRGIRYLWEQKLYSSDPSVSIKNRWGFSAEDVFVNISKKLEDGLLKRQKKLAYYSQGCVTDCSPRRGGWWDQNTYKLDYSLLELNHIYRSYCYYLPFEDCEVQKSRVSQGILEIGEQALTIKEWMDRVPIFNSDPRAGQANRWGNYSDHFVVHLNPFDSIQISKDNLAIINNNKILDLKSNSFLSMPRDLKKLFMGKQGHIVALTVDSQKSTRLYLLKALNWKMIFEKQQFQGKYKTYFRASNDIVVNFIDKATQKELFYRVDTKLEQMALWFEKPTSFAHKFNERFLIYKVGEDKGVIVDLKTGDLHQDISFGDLDIMALDLKWVVNSTIVGNYRHKDEDRYFPVLVNTGSKQISHIGDQKSYLVWVNQISGAAVWKFGLNDDFNKFYYSTVSGDLLQRGKFIGNIFLEASQIGQKSLLLMADRDNWDMYPLHQLFLADAESVQKSDLGTNAKPLALNGSNVVASSEEATFMIDIETSKKRYLPEMIYIKFGNSSSVLSPLKSMPIWRFNNGHGDFAGFGGIALARDTEFGSEFIPKFSLYTNRFNNSREAKIWADRFANTEVNSGILIETGTEMATWVLEKTQE
ncbi:MAG: hypothetical protein ISR65_15650 [Bacteriovoracaceae bacterium]|nr:hypothetical protein [Bacteriovoracaceae bacterium]